MSIIVDEDKLLVLTVKRKEIKGKKVKTVLRGGLSHLLIHSDKTPHRLHTAFVHN